MQTLHDAINQLYKVYARYSTAGMAYCDCGCTPLEEVVKLHAKPLRELEEADLVYYHGSALYTWGEVEHYKHFIPRICELMAGDTTQTFVGLEELFVKLQFANWEQWPLEEREALLSFVASLWSATVREQTFPLSYNRWKEFTLFFDVTTLLSYWPITYSDQTITHFVAFFYEQGNLILTKDTQAEDREVKAAFVTWLKQQNLKEALTHFFFKVEARNPELAEKTSIVLQILEQQSIL